MQSHNGVLEVYIKNHGHSTLKFLCKSDGTVLILPFYYVHLFLYVIILCEFYVFVCLLPFLTENIRTGLGLYCNQNILLSC